MIAVLRGGALDREVGNATSEIERASAEVGGSGSLLPLVEPRVATSLDETLHAFLKEARRKPTLQVIAEATQSSGSSAHRLRSSFTNIATRGGRRNNGGIVPTVGMFSRSDLNAEEEKRNLAELIGKPPEERSALGAAVMLNEEAGTFAMNMQQAQLLAQKLTKEVRAPPDITMPLARGFSAGDLFPLVAQAVLVAVILQPVVVSMAGVGKKIVSRFRAGDD